MWFLRLCVRVRALPCARVRCRVSCMLAWCERVCLCMCVHVASASWRVCACAPDCCPRVRLQLVSCNDWMCARACVLHATGCESLLAKAP